MDWKDKLFVTVVVVGSISAVVTAFYLTIHIFKIGGITIIGVH